MTRMTLSPDRNTPIPPIADPDDARWIAVKRRDASADGHFYYAVRTTGVYCRPSCAARLPRRENVSFYATRAEAEQAGFRPCKRCRPGDAAQASRHAAAIARACRLIETAEEPPALAELADAAGLSRYHFHRIFKQIAGVTPKAYASAHRAKRVRSELGQSDTVTRAIFDAGFNSSGRFYEGSTKILGMTPGAYRDGGAGAEIRFAVAECSLGAVLVAATGKGVVAIEFGADPERLVHGLQDRFPKAGLTGGDAAFERMVAEVIGAVEAPRQGLDLPIDVRGTAFQQRVWQALRQIPPGSTASYAEIARRIGNPAAVRAVAQACAVNPAAVVIPCHRVVRSNGDLGGYRWGIERKRELLRREGAV
ncbi:bifunctional DNA-binding transcriptional regulator/O6-methylguanine-DNA methyltransferase Ada [Acidiphilium iwatense]